MTIGQLGGRPVIVSAGARGLVKTWDLVTLQPVGRPFIGDRQGLSALALYQLTDRTIALTGGNENTTWMWDLATGQRFGRPLAGRRYGVESIAIGKLDGKTIIVAASDDGATGGLDNDTRGTVKAWNLEPLG